MACISTETKSSACYSKQKKATCKKQNATSFLYGKCERKISWYKKRRRGIIANETTLYKRPKWHRN